MSLLMPIYGNVGREQLLSACPCKLGLRLNSTFEVPSIQTALEIGQSSIKTQLGPTIMEKNSWYTLSNLFQLSLYLPQNK